MDLNPRHKRTHTPTHMSIPIHSPYKLNKYILSALVSYFLWLERVQKRSVDAIIDDDATRTNKK